MAFRVPSFVLRARREKRSVSGRAVEHILPECINAQQLPLYCVMTSCQMFS